MIILCTGYNVEFPFLPEQHRSQSITDLYKYVFDINDPSLAFVGYVRPIIGSIPGISEMQARWVCRVFSGSVSLADQKSRATSVRVDREFWTDFFQDTSQRISTLVDGYTYLDQVAKVSDCYPDYWSLFKRSPRAWMRAYFAPYNGCSYLLNQPEKQDMALKTLSKHSSDTINPLHLLFLLFLRLIMFDWILDILGDIKYAFQTNRTWQNVREFKVVKFVDYIWTTPKRLAFDNKTR